MQAVATALTDFVARRVADGPPGPGADGLPAGPQSPPVAQMFGFLFRPASFLEACRDRFGDALTIRIPGVPPIVQFSDPDAIKQVFASGHEDMHAGEANSVLEPFLGTYSLLILDGERHLSQRRLLLPPFRGERMRAYGEAMRDITRERMARWPLGRTFRMQSATQDITLDVILRTVFGMEEGAQQDRMRELLVRALRILDNPVFIVRTFQKDYGPLSPWGRFLRLREEVYAEMAALVSERRRERDAGGPERDDILSMLLGATHEDGTPMSDEEIRDELFTLLIAGHETTATALSWTVSRLTEHPDVLARVQRELDEAFPDGEVDPAKLRELPYLDAVCKETLRVHPVIPGVGRVLQRPQTIGGHALPAGVAVGCSIYLAHTNPAVWPEPGRFDPERFLGARPTPYTFFPFGGGIRRCIGEAFALYEMRVVLATVLLRLVPEAAPGYRPRTVRRNITLTPARGLPIRFRRR
ncbi:MAG TPA: cytochrome P450 [Polyangiaceae bacterium LLY-WYZ-15_(1-7)]|nr:cytochrome P450 [Myxococcales bacterium]MAT27840.1 cytochrome P450 [Sandaracinus sp.]HJL05850.1 cytochrome P450 [Polyangiaceae bacterium LLY-WYZ-15_(1-7)]MBJ71276.1 cytochrome P450 [Sandaracinus sp.]HJL13870.1 cytochrome P450 [Polyangiaceae bacterium LLY-WYZ-15_(1-7)]